MNEVTGVCVCVCLCVCAVLQTVQAIRDGDLPEEGAATLHRLCEGERSAVSAHMSHTGNQQEKENERGRKRENDPFLLSARRSGHSVIVQTHTCSVHY